MDLSERFEKEKEAYAQVEVLISDKNARHSRMRYFIRNLKQVDGPLETFDATLWNLMLEEVMVSQEGDIEIKFKGL